MPMTEELSAITEPTERSMPRVPMARLWPSAIRITGAESNSRLRITAGLRNPGVTMKSNTTSAAKAM
jgi:hypothetical protein